ncbi:hypothetical protein [Leucobacter chinensis]|uniref:hypothetical protein n=1 Tax=Leucobacter chinensis TaxID=2851010 RepID=UPI001C22F446|nr:hypothetical protein [Leucobacter chinensis]
MANGKGMRWGGHLGIPKHLITINGETLLHRITRQILEREPDADVIISSSNPAYETEGARLHAPKVNELEIDRFAPELITDNVCFLYGDTCYQDSAVEKILSDTVDEIAFFGDPTSIVAVKSAAPQTLRYHLARVRELFLAGEITSCIGWQVYQSYESLPFSEKQISHNFYRLDGETAGFNSPSDLEAFLNLPM